MKQELERVFGPADGPMQIPSEFHDMMRFDPLEGGQIALDGIHAFLGWITNFLLTQPLTAVGMLALIVIVVFTIPYGGDSRS